MNQTNQTNQMNHLRTLPPPPQHGEKPRIARLADLLVVVSACTLETLPIFCWLLMLASYDTGNPNNAAMPIWGMWLLVFGIYWLGRLFLRGTDDRPRRRRINTLLLTATVVVLGPLSLLGTYFLSPAAQGFLANGSDTSGPIGLALLVVWLWWRGLYLSRERATRARIYIRYVMALGVTISALAGAAAIHNASRDLTASYLSLLLALLLFVGTMGLTIAQARDATYEMQSAYRGSQPLEMPPVFTRAWLAASLGLSLGLSLLALLLATIFSRQSVRVLAIAAGNVANGVLEAIQVVLTPVFFLIYLILNKPIEWLANLLKGFNWATLPATPTPPPNCAPTSTRTPASGVVPAGNPCLPPAHTPVTSLLPQEWLTALRWGTLLLIVVVAVLLLARALSRFTDVRRIRAFSDERTMLDAREILGNQLRRFFTAFRRTPQDVALMSDDLASGSIRRVYRDTLAAAAATGRARRSVETPREYQHRITSDNPMQPGTVPSSHVAGALAELTSAYEQARYGQPDSDASLPATPEMVSAAEAVQRWLTEQHVE